MRVTSVMILLESGRQHILTLLYQESRGDSNATLIALYKARKSQRVANKTAKGGSQRSVMSHLIQGPKKVKLYSDIVY